ncbi:hypothetical protein EDB81DRAFT_839002 [Dactylonectria macrodidyma]|uniref:Metallo-beta-lactamase domain-containing protein n=1 Tax=Dactylonectria macrodidyma TaxID=307937 RepID=A0A9P9JFZ5_9HYPO|nr:hypothetical protein EDB81DRAFT_839002 [Dactylonectria macrodidyma]
MVSVKFIHLTLLSAALATAIPLTETSCSVESILDSALEALGGESVLNDLQGVTYHSPNTYRSRSLMQSYEMTRADTAIAISGHQNISFSFKSDELQQRIDRQFVPSDYWIWSSPTLSPFNFSLVVQSGDDGFACYVNGNNQIWLPSDLASGYTDFHDSHLELTVIFDPSTNLPYIVRTFEDHPIHGASTFDLYLTDYKTVEGLKFPHQIQSVYNSTSRNLDAVLEDFTIEKTTVNPKFPSGFFDGIPEDESMFPKAAPHKVEGFSHARITEFSSNMLWSGLKNTTAEDLNSTQPIPGLPSVHWLILEGDDVGVKQMIIEFETEVIVCDAAPQHSLSVIQWIADNLNKPITHLWPTHHHRDHSGGAKDFVEVGAKLIVPEMAVQYWSSIPNATFVTFNDTHPYVHSDENTQAWFMWEPQGFHASDLSYSFVTTKCPSNDSPVAVFEADVWQAGVSPALSDQAQMRQWLDQVMNDGLTKDAIVLPTHGQVTPLLELINITGYPYPQLSTLDWRTGAAKCDS